MMKVFTILTVSLISFPQAFGFTPSPFFNYGIKRTSFIEPLLSKSDGVSSDDEKTASVAVNDSKEQAKEINKLLKDKEQKITAINRLKFQLNELRSAAEESETKRADAEKKLEELTKDSESIKKQNTAEYEQLQAKMSEEKESLQKELVASNEKMKQMKLDSQKEYEALQKLSEKEKVEYAKEITSLQKALDETNQSILKAKEDMSAMSKNSASELKGKVSEITKKDEEIERLSIVKSDYEEKIRSLEEQFETQNKALEESKKLSLELQAKLDQGLEENKIERLANLDSIAKMKEQMEVEKESFSTELLVVRDEMKVLKQDSEKEIQSIQDERSVEKNAFQEKLFNLQSELDTANEKLDRAKKSVNEVRRAADEKVSRIQKDSDKFKANMRNLAIFDKKEMKRKVWDLEFKVKQAKYDLISKDKEANALKAAVSEFEQKIGDLEEMHKKEVYDLEQKMVAEEMFYAKSRAQNRQRIIRMVEKFQKRISRQQIKAIGKLKNAEEELQQILQVDYSSDKDGKETINGKSADVSNLISKVAEQMESEKKEFETKVIELEKAVADTTYKAQKEMNNMKEDYESKLKLEQRNAEKVKNELLLEKDNEMIKIDEENRRKIDLLRMELTNKLNASEGELKLLKKTLKEKDSILSTYEKERRSYRKLAKLALKATREKVSTVIKRRRKQ